MKKLIALFAVAAMAGLAQADVLYWMVGGTQMDLESWDSAKLYANKTGYNYGGELVASISRGDLEFLDTVTSSKVDGAGYSFYLELFKGTDSVGKSYLSSVAMGDSSNQGAVSWADLVKAGAVVSDIMEAGTATPYAGFAKFTTADVVPEPTSGLLVLLGMAVLGLKRKRV